MGRYSKQGNKKKGSGSLSGRAASGGFGNPKIPKAKQKRDSAGSDGQKKSPLLQHFFFWVVVLSMFMGIFGGFQAQIQSIVLWNDVYTLFGAISYTDATIGWTISIVFAMCVDMILVS